MLAGIKICTWNIEEGSYRLTFSSFQLYLFILTRIIMHCIVQIWPFTLTGTLLNIILYFCTNMLHAMLFYNAHGITRYHINVHTFFRIISWHHSVGSKVWRSWIQSVCLMFSRSNVCYLHIYEKKRKVSYVLEFYLAIVLKVKSCQSF